MQFGVNGAVRVTIATGAATFSGDVFVSKLITVSNANAGTIDFGTSSLKGIMDYSAGSGLWKLNNQSAGAASTLYYQFQGDGTALVSILKNGQSTFINSVFATTFFVPANEGIAFNGQGSFKTAIYSRNTGADLCFNAGDAERGRIVSTGNWLLGTTSDNGERLYVSGNIRATGTITANSDISLKKNLLKIENALEKVEQINGYTYEFKADDSKRHAGVIAQEIQTVLPEIVNTGNDGLMGVEYGNISALLIEAIKEQQVQIEELKTLLKA
jgi:hypothetical protein